MTKNLLKTDWAGLDSMELRLLLNERVGGHGQYSGSEQEDLTKLYLPLADESCRVVLRYSGKNIIAVEPGKAFDANQWTQINDEIDTSLLAGPLKVGRDFSFSGFRVSGSWRGNRSGVQILPPLDSAPRAQMEMAEHPFVLEFPIREANLWEITNYRRRREHRKLTLLLNVLLRGHTSFQSSRAEHFWGTPLDGTFRSTWIQRSFFADLGQIVIDSLSPAAAERLEEIDSAVYYAEVGNDGKGLRVPTDLDEAICRYQELAPISRAKFDRALFWMDIASRHWNTSTSSSFASLVSAVESLTDRGTTHRVYCEKCGKDSQHEVPGAIERFRAFFETYAPEASLRRRRTEMYELRSGILHGSKLMTLDEDLAFGWDPPWWNERTLHEELWGLTRVAMRNWLSDPPIRASISREATSKRIRDVLSRVVQHLVNCARKVHKLIWRF